MQRTLGSYSRTKLYAFFFDGASNVEKAGENLCATYPRAFCFHGGKHVLSLFFSDLAHFQPIKANVRLFFVSVYCTPLIILQILILKTCRLYNAFGFGGSHGIHAQFMTQASALNNGKRIGLLRGAGTRFATWFYAMHRLLRQKRALYATVHSPAFQTLAHNTRVALAV